MAEAKKKEIKKSEPEDDAIPLESEAPAEQPKKASAKAGKRSAKAIKEAEEKQAKEERKAEAKTDEKPSKPKTVVKPARSRAERAGKKYREAAKTIDKSKLYSLAEAMDLVTKTSPTKFDGTVELHINLDVDPKQADQNVRDNVVLPGGTGKSVKVAVLAEDDDAAKSVGADITGTEKILANLDKGLIDFDVLISTPDVMPKLGKYARVLGPRGLMPNPKSGTVTKDIKTAVQEAKGGKVEYRVDESGIIHLAIGKVSFGKDMLAQNAEAVLGSVRAAKPASVKGTYIKSVYVASTMGPSIKVETSGRS